MVLLSFFQWFSHVLLLESLKCIKMFYDSKQCKSEFDIELYTNNEHVITKMYKCLLWYDIE